MHPRQTAGRRTFYGHVILGALLYAIILAYPLLSPILLSFLLILLVCLAVNPVIVWLQKYVGRRGLSVFIVVGVMVAAIGVAGWIVSIPIRESGSKFLDRVPEYWERMQKPLIKMEHKAEASETQLKNEVADEVAREEGKDAPTPRPASKASGTTADAGSTTHMFRSMVTPLFELLASSAKNLASNLASLVLVGVTVFFGVIFALPNPTGVLGLFFGLVPEQHLPKAKRIGERIAVFVPQWALATGLAMLCVGGLVFLATWPIFGLADALVLGLIAAVLEAVPYLGPILSAVPALLLAVGEGGWTPLWVLAIYAGIQALENNVISPLIMSGRLKLNPVAVIFSMLLSVIVFGVLGVLVAVPAVAVIQILREELYRPAFQPGMTDKELDQMAEGILDGGASRAHRVPKA